MDIDMYRREAKEQKRGGGSEKKTGDGIFRKTLNFTDSNSMKKEIKLLENKVAVMRKKIDEQN